MMKSTRVRIVLVSSAVLLLAAGGWLYTHRPAPVEIATYVPESAIGYLEVNNLPQLLSQMTSTKAWQQLAPAYGVSDKLGYVGQLGQSSSFGWLAGLAGNNEVSVLSQAQFAAVITSLEVRGDAIKPRLALLAETHSRPGALHDLIEKRLPEMAEKLFGQAKKETSEYSGVPILSFAAPDAGRKLLAAQIEGELILANHEEPLRACIDTRLGHAPSIARNSYLSKARPAAGANASVFGFVTGEGVKRLLRLGTYLAAGGVVGKAVLAGAIGEVFTNFSGKTCDGIAYGWSFENGQVVDRYAVLLKPEMTEKLQTFVKANANEPRTLAVIPAAAREVTIINVANPSKTLDGIESAISSRVDAAQSFLLHQFVIGMREAAFGAKSGELTGAAIGDEIASFDLTKEAQGRVWLVAVKDRALTARLAEQILTQFQGKRTAAVSHENLLGFDVMSSSESSRGSAVFLGDFLAVGRREQLIRLIESRRSGQSLKSAPQFASAAKPSLAAPLVSLSSVKEGSGEMMTALARAFGQSPMPANVNALEQLPLAFSLTSLNQEGLLIESYSPFGNFPFLVSLVDGSTNR